MWYDKSIVKGVFMDNLPVKAPDFKLLGSDGKEHQLKDYQGKWLLIYFYPKDQTPGCTAQACSIRDHFAELKQAGLELIGVSADSDESHQKFIAKHELNFTLLSDPDKKMIEAYGAWGVKMFGKFGILRRAVIINPEGQIVKLYKRAKTVGFAERVLEDFAQLKQ